MLSPGLVSITFRQKRPREIIELVHRAGLQAIEWGGDVHVPHGDIHRAKQVGQMTRDAGIAVAAYGSYYRVGHEDEVAFDVVLDSAIALQTKVIRVWAGRQGSVQADDVYRELIVNESRRIADLAAGAGITLAYEFHGGTLTDTGDSAQRLLQEVGHEAMQSYWQPPVGISAEEGLTSLNTMLPWLQNVHVFHWGKTSAERFPLAEGAAVWQSYLRAASSTLRDHFLLMEFVPNDSPDSFLQDAATLLQWISNLQGKG